MNYKDTQISPSAETDWPMDCRGGRDRDGLRPGIFADCLETHWPRDSHRATHRSSGSAGRVCIAFAGLEDTEDTEDADDTETGRRLSPCAGQPGGGEEIGQAVSLHGGDVLSN